MAPQPDGVASVIAETAFAAGQDAQLAAARTASQPAPRCQLTPLPKTVAISEIASVLRGADFTKGEFETTAEYKKRSQEKLQRVNQIIQRGGRAELVFSIPIPEYWIEYNADSGVITIGNMFLGLLPSSTDHKKGHYIIISSTQKELGTYVGVNAFGAKKEVMKRESNVLNVFIPGGGGIAWPSNFKPISAPASKDVAREMKKNLAVIFVANLSPPYYGSDRRREPPEFNAPFDRTTYRETIYVEVNCAAIINKSTNGIIKRIESSSLR